MEFRHYLVRGRVQGVGFRNFTRKRAATLKLSGWVRNLRDGRVEVLAGGEEGALAEFERAIERGPAFARVDGIERATADPGTGSAGFKVREDGEAPWAQGS